jgi:hypothetical protein
MSQTSTAQEEKRFQVSKAFFERTIQNLNENTQGCIIKLVFDLDEVRISDWEDRKLRDSLDPGAMCDQTIRHGVSRDVKYSSVIAHISAARKSLFSYIVTLDNSSPFQKHLKKQDACFGRGLISKFNQKLCINSVIVIDYIRTVFLPCLVRLRDLVEFAEEVAVLLMEKCSADITDDVILLLTEARVHVIAFAPCMNCRY